MPDISVIIPVYNRKHTLKRAVDSVLLQDGVDWELVVVDDGSDDGTATLLRQYAGDGRITVLEQPNRGVSSARNAGVRASRAGYLAFLDSDDEWLPGKLKAQMDFFSQSDFRIHQTREIWVRDGVRVNPPRHLMKREGDLFPASLERCMITPSSAAMTRELFERFGGFDEAYPACEDYELWLRITAGHKVGLIRKAYLIRYGGHHDQLSSSITALDQYRIRAMVKLLDKGGISATQRAHCLRVLKKKLSIFKKGCVKRNKTHKLQWCENIEKAYLC
ncbi:glycosyltransferase family 2 protein [Fibrobacterota bacterium]